MTSSPSRSLSVALVAALTLGACSNSDEGVATVASGGTPVVAAQPPERPSAPEPASPKQGGASEAEILQLLWDDSTPEEQQDWCELISLMGPAQFASMVVTYFPGELSPSTVSVWSSIHCTDWTDLEGKDRFLDTIWTSLSPSARSDACAGLASAGPLVAGAMVIQGLGQGLTFTYTAPDGSFSLDFTAEDFAELLLERC